MTVPELTLEGPRPLRGRIRVPGDKGISHRALLFASLATGVSTLRHLADGDDVARTTHPRVLHGLFNFFRRSR